MVEGSITIEALLGTNKFDKQVADLEKKIEKEEDKKILIEAKLSTQQQELEKQRQKVDELAEAYQRLQETQKALESGKATPAQFATFQELQNTYGSLEKLEETFDKALTKQDLLEQKVAQTKYRYDEINNKVAEYKQKINSTNIQKQVADAEKLKQGFNNVGNSLESSIKKVARLALGIFGLRSAYMALRRASSDLASYDEQYATNLEYIRYALTQAVAPVLRYIVNLAATLLQYINMILNALFGINIFSRGSAESFNKMKAGASGVSKAVKEIKKQLAGFDEMNVLTDQSDTGAGGGGAGGITTPSFDLSAMQGEVPKWLKWIIDNKDLILSTLAGIAAGLTAIKLGASGLQGLGIGLMVAGVVYAVKSLLDYLKDPTWENFGKIIQGIGIAIIGLGIIIGIATGNWVLAIVGAVILIVGTIAKHWEEIKAFFQNGINWLKDKSDDIHEKFGDVIGSIYDFFVATLQAMLDFADKKFNALKDILDGIIEFVKGVFAGDWNKAFEGLKKTVSGFLNFLPSMFTNTLNMIKGLVTNWGTSAGQAFGGAFKAAVNAILSIVEKTLNAPIRAINNLLGVINEVPGVNLGYLNPITLPRMKRGGILNVPNKGTLVGGGTAIAGESGHEGYIPLSDKQAMSELGREIGKWININATIPISVGNRQIAREIKRINAENDFAYNI